MVLLASKEQIVVVRRWKSTDGSGVSDDEKQQRMGMTQQPTDTQMLEWSRYFPSTQTLCGDSWKALEVNALGAELWEDLSETMGMPPRRLIQFLDTIRYLLFVADSNRTWDAGSFDAVRVTTKVWDAEHLEAYRKIEQERMST